MAALVAHDVGPCAAHVLRLAATGAPPASIEPYRGWDADDWAATADELRSRGWLGAGGGITEAGRAVHDDASVEALLDALHPLALRLGEGLIPYPNPMGVPRPAR